jgi:hypothetical protein
MTFLELKQDVARRLAEVNGRVFWSNQDIGDAVNLGYAEMSDACEWKEAYLEVDLLNDRPYYDLFRLIGDSFLGIRPIFDEQTNRWLIPSSARQLDTNDRRWERVTGEPQRCFLRGLRWLGLYPRIQSDVGLVKVYYTALPDPLVNDDDEPGFPEAFHGGIVDFALTDLFAQDGETAFALACWKDYLEQEARLSAWVNGRAADPLVTGLASPGGTAR